MKKMYKNPKTTTIELVGKNVIMLNSRVGDKPSADVVPVGGDNEGSAGD